MRIENEQQNEARMEIHFPHLTNGIAPVRPTRRHRARTFRKLAISSAIALAAVVGVIGASSANAGYVGGVDAEIVLVNGKILHIEQKNQSRSYTVIHNNKLFHCFSDRDYGKDNLIMECMYRD